MTRERDADFAAMLREHAAAEQISEAELVERALCEKDPEPCARFVLDDEQWAAFSATLNRPAKAIPAVRELFARPRPE